MQLARTDHLLIVADFDGTLAGIVPDPSKVPVNLAACEVLARLAQLPDTTVAVLSGRGLLAYDLHIPTEKVGTFDTELTEEFFLAFTRTAACTLHLRQLAGTNSHHIIEGAFKSAARSLRQACAIDAAFAGEIPSTKGVL